MSTFQCSRGVRFDDVGSGSGRRGVGGGGGGHMPPGAGRVGAPSGCNIKKKNLSCLTKINKF